MEFIINDNSVQTEIVDSGFSYENRTTIISDPVVGLYMSNTRRFDEVIPLRAARDIPIDDLVQITDYEFYYK